MLTIINYHYVRDPEQTRFPGLKALRVGEFHAQLAYLERCYSFVTLAEVFAALDEPEAEGILPPNAVLLTFDDGYREHYDIVFPLLRDRGIQGLFFVPAASSRFGRMLAVNKIQLIVSSCRDPALLTARIEAVIEANQGAEGVAPVATYRERWFEKGLYDPPELIYPKRLLQTALPEALREEIVDTLFAEWVTGDETGLAAEFYALPGQLSEMVEQGMYVGPHGVDHKWMDRLPIEAMEREIADSLAFMRELGAPTGDWVACYPYGRHSKALVESSRRHGARCGVTVEPRVADPRVDDAMLLPRMDTNEFPKALPMPPSAP